MSGSYLQVFIAIFILIGFLYYMIRAFRLRAVERERCEVAKQKILHQVEELFRQHSVDDVVLYLDIARRYLKASYDSPQEVLSRFTRDGTFATVAFVKTMDKDLAALEAQRLEDKRAANAVARDIRMQAAASALGRSASNDLSKDGPKSFKYYVSPRSIGPNTSPFYEYIQADSEYYARILMESRYPTSSFNWRQSS